MRNWLWILLALLVGMVLGAWGPKADLRQAREELERLRKLGPSRSGSGAGLNGITSMLRIPETGAAAAARRAPNPDSHSGGAAVANTGATPRVRSRPDFHDPEDEESGRAPPSLHDRIQSAMDVWKVRVDLARNTFVSSVATNGDQAAQFDWVMADMNARLGSAIREWVDYLKTQKEVTPENGVRMMSDLSSDLVQTYDQLDATLPADWRDKAGDKFQVFDFIDPQVALPLTEVEQTLRFPTGRRLRAGGGNPE